MTDGHRLVIGGGGVCGLDLATHLAGRRTSAGVLKVTLIDNETAHVWKPMLHTIAAGTRDVYQQQVAYLSQARQRGFVFNPGEMIRLDQTGKTITLAGRSDPDGQMLFPERMTPYDTLILALGSRANDFGTPGIAQHCHTIDSRSQAMAFNEQVRLGIMRSFVQNKPLGVAIVGGGATGVELASEIVQLAESSEFYGAFGMIKKVRITLLESSDRLLTAFPERVAHDGRQRLEALGVTVMTGASVTAAEPTGFRLRDGTLVEADLKVWAAGVKAPDALSGGDGLELTRSHQIVVRANLQSTRDPSIYAVGDCASLTPEGQSRPLAPTAQVAHQQAAYLSVELPKLLASQSGANFVYKDFGSLLSLGGYGAFGSLGKFGFFKGGFIRGRVAQLGHALLYRSHQARLHGFWRGGLLG